MLRLPPPCSNYKVSGTELFKYTDKLRESVTGLYYSMARWYDPQVGRFVSEDSYGGSLKDPMSMNRYVYARDNPMTLVDPSGKVYTDEQAYGDTNACTTADCSLTQAQMDANNAAMVGASTSTSTTTTSTCTVSSDVCLSQSGGTTTTTATTTTSTNKGSTGTTNPSSRTIQSFLLNHLLQIGLDVAETILLFLDPVLIGDQTILREMAIAAASVITSLLSCAGTSGCLSTDLATGNFAQAGWDLLTNTGTIVTTTWNALDFGSKLTFGVTTGAWQFVDAGSGGTADEAMLAIGVVNLANDFGQLAAEWSSS